MITPAELTSHEVLICVGGPVSAIPVVVGVETYVSFGVGGADNTRGVVVDNVACHRSDVDQRRVDVDGDGPAGQHACGQCCRHGLSDVDSDTLVAGGRGAGDGQIFDEEVFVRVADGGAGCAVGCATIAPADDRGKHVGEFDCRTRAG